jgi:hypothetical protein
MSMLGSLCGGGLMYQMDELGVGGAYAVLIVVNIVCTGITLFFIHEEVCWPRALGAHIGLFRSRARCSCRRSRPTCRGATGSSPSCPPSAITTSASSSSRDSCACEPERVHPPGRAHVCGRAACKWASSLCKSTFRSRARAGSPHPLQARSRSLAAVLPQGRHRPRLLPGALLRDHASKRRLCSRARGQGDELVTTSAQKAVAILFIPVLFGALSRWVPLQPRRG